MDLFGLALGRRRLIVLMKQLLVMPKTPHTVLLDVFDGLKLGFHSFILYVLARKYYR